MKHHRLSSRSAFPLVLTLATLFGACESPELQLPEATGGGGAAVGGAGGSGGAGGDAGSGGTGGTASDPAEPLFAAKSIPRIDITLSPSAMNSLGAMPYEYVSGNVDVELDGTKIKLPSVGVRLKGKIGSYRQLDGKAAFVLDFNKYEKQSLLGIEKLALNNMVQDPSMSREYLGYTLFRDMLVPAPRTAWAEVYVNGQLYGLYTTVESTDNDVFLRKWFGSDDGNLYEGEYGSDLELGLEYSFDQDSGMNVGAADLVELMQALDQMNDPQTFFTDVAKVVDIEEYVRFAAIEIYLGHWDGYAYARNNYFIYRRPGDGRWVFMPWGIDQTLYDRLNLWGAGGRMQAMCTASQPCRNALAEAYQQVVQRVSALGLAQRAAELEAFLWPAIVNDPRKEVDSGTVSQAIAENVYFLQERPNDVTAQLICANPNAVDADNDGASGCGFDCDDGNAQVSPNAPELCNFTDDNCNGILDDDPSCPQCVTQPHPGGGTLAFCFGARPWNEAEADCVAQGGHLASIHDQATQDLITSGATAVAGGDWWLGLSDQAQEGVFVWTDGTPVNYVNWMEGEPNNWDGNEHCMHLVDWAGGGWNDLPCDVQAKYVCKLP